MATDDRTCHRELLDVLAVVHVHDVDVRINREVFKVLGKMCDCRNVLMHYLFDFLHETHHLELLESGSARCDSCNKRWVVDIF